ncbi:DUF2637 domain-containing protein [Actinoallomurus sp. NBC_01490]|uniref:DUF2637 domain-containing protein n=1 Tax=Actinoallomurus sp. NBC_01490 TaxID=2903557 RepID=UPI002E348A4D|nr:DUF2637 domain-containing protein [Actinoallomurus sp. NBC_01490]
MSVVVLAGIAAVLSYKHMFILVRRYGETSWTSALLPVSVDGMIIASSMTLLADSRNGQRSGLLPWTLLVVGSAASLAANVAVAEPSAVGRLIAAWPSCALIGSYELLMRQVRHTAARKAPLVLQVPAARPAAEGVGSYAPHTMLVSEDPAAYDTHTSASEPITASYDAQTDSSEELIHDTDKAHPRGPAQVNRGRARPRRSTSELQHAAWQWAIANRTPAGNLPSGKAIAERFGRRERWGRLVKQTGTTGGFGQKSAAQI